jgi:PIN domain nuclease of toxin-antitoxin system
MNVVVDTNALIWLLKDSYLLGARAGQRIDEALRTGRVMMSAASLWQVAALVSTKRIGLDKPLDRWRLDVARLGIEEVPIDGAMAIAASDMLQVHPNLASRLVAATARLTGTALVTSDVRLLAWKGQLACIDARV